MIASPGTTSAVTNVRVRMSARSTSVGDQRQETVLDLLLARRLQSKAGRARSRGRAPRHRRSAGAADRPARWRRFPRERSRSAPAPFGPAPAARAWPAPLAWGRRPPAGAIPDGRQRRRATGLTGPDDEKVGAVHLRLPGQRILFASPVGTDPQGEIAAHLGVNVGPKIAGQGVRRPRGSPRRASGDRSPGAGARAPASRGGRGERCTTCVRAARAARRARRRWPAKSRCPPRAREGRSVRALAGRSWGGRRNHEDRAGGRPDRVLGDAPQKEARRPFSRVGSQHQQLGADGAGVTNDVVLHAKLNERPDIDPRRSQRLGLCRHRRFGGGAQVVDDLVQHIR